MPFQLVIVKGRSANQALRISPEGVTTVGRQQGCQIRIGSSQVSRKHCELFEKQGHLLVKDLGSSNGVFVNGKRIQGQQVLEPGNILTIGAVVFRVEQAAVPAAAGRPNDTAVSQAAVGADADVELDFEITDESLDEDDQTVTSPHSAPAKAPMATPIPVDKAGPSSPAKASPSTPAKEAEAAPELVSEESNKALSEDAVAEYLLNIDLDDEDKL
jgi:hypothetical protein